MPKYFIDVRDQQGVIPDEEGREFPDLEQGFQEAIATARDLIQQYVASRTPIDGTCVELRDEGGQVVATLAVSELLDHPVHPEFRNACPATAKPQRHY
jgi:hypothetical protein